MIAVAGFMTTLDNTVVNVALPSIQRDLHISLSTLEWVATSYILIFASLMLAGGRMADVYGRKKIFLIGLAIFTAASGLAGLAQTAETLIAARVVQGAGGALVIPAGLALVTVGRTEREQATGTVVWVGSAALALALGPLTGGYIAQHWAWNWIFLINLAPGVLVVILGLLVIPESRDTTADGVDLPGMLASGTTLFAVTYALSEVSAHGWGSAVVLGAFALAAVGLVALITVERWASTPMIDLVFFRSRAFAGGVAVQILWGVGFNGVLFYASLFLQQVLRFSPTRTGSVFLPPAVVIAVLTPVSFWVGKKIGARSTIAWGLVLMAAGMTAFALLRPGDGYVDLLPGVALIGVGSALNMPLTAYVLGSVPDERSGVAGGILSVAREVSGAFGIAVIGLIIAARQRSEVASGVRHAAAFEHATSIGLLCGAGLVCLGALIAVVSLPARKRRARHALPYSPARGEAADHPAVRPEDRPPLLTWSPPAESTR
ncbi:MFS transporter [Actinoallomurus purpureus]|uniref:MFS transporter n=1 Tax=Actinoallomurus purpureus TaxID=478114 RepID=UPI00209276F3|nr:MFS transporter [Actinoallomurus purpureus]MCO6009311.1 MFS transporter [Actinoallomurus purpureus]